MSLPEIISELPKLTADERSVVRRRLSELHELDEMQFLQEAAEAMFQEMDREEAEYDDRKAG